MNIFIKIIKKISDIFGAIGYYLLTIFIAILISIAVVSTLFLSSYSEITKEYANIQIAWNNVDADIASDIAVVKNQLTVLKTLNNIDNLYYSENLRNLTILTNMVQEIDNAMSYQQKVSIYNQVETVIQDTASMTQYLDINNEYPFNAEELLENNLSLKEQYNSLCSKMNNKISSKKYKIITNAFSLHNWTTLP